MKKRILKKNKNDMSDSLIWLLRAKKSKKGLIPWLIVVTAIIIVIIKII